MVLRALIAVLALVPIACAGLVAQPAPTAAHRPLGIGELIREHRQWQVAVREGRYGQAKKIYERWGQGLRHAGSQTRSDPDFAENESAFRRAASVDRRVSNVVKLRPRATEIEDLMAVFRQEAALATAAARSLADCDDRKGQLEQLQRGIERLKTLRRQGRPFEKVEPYRSFSAWEAETIAWLHTRADEAEWAIKVGLLISSPISQGARATQLARTTSSPVQRRNHLKAAAASFRKCITVAADAARAGGYSDQFTLDTPAGRVDLGTLKASCKKATAKVARMKRSRRM